MECFKIENLSFTYPNRSTAALKEVSFSVNAGEFVLFCGASGCGKTTLLRLLKSSLAPFGNRCGRILFQGKELSKSDVRAQAQNIGFVMQNPDHQIVTDKVWHELAFGLESLGCPTVEIRTRVAEMASFFGIQTWFHKKVSELSGGQKQLLNLAAVLVMQPTVLILDEPTSQLDPIAAQEFLKMLEKVNRELGITVLLSEHRLEEAFSLADRVIVLDNGTVIANEKPQKVAEILYQNEHDMAAALPCPLQVYAAVPNDLPCPLTVREGRNWLEAFSKEHPLYAERIPALPVAAEKQEIAIEIKDAWFRYEQNLPDVIKGLNLKVGKGELLAIVGGNGTGKTTALSLISGLLRPYRGKVFINGQPVFKTDPLYHGVLGVLPQDPQSVFSQKTVYLDLQEMLSDEKLSLEEMEQRMGAVSTLCRIEQLWDCHPYDLSGGEQQRAALAKVLLRSPEILLLDEPTKGMDAPFRAEFADLLKQLNQNGVTIVMVSHDIEFCAEYADRCAMFFDGGIASVGTARSFFSGKSFYTTAACRMARTQLSNAVLTDDIILACGQTPRPKKKRQENILSVLPKNEKPTGFHKKKPISRRGKVGLLFLLCFLLTEISLWRQPQLWEFFTIPLIRLNLGHLLGVMEIVGALFCWFPSKEMGTQSVLPLKSDQKLPQRTITALVIILCLIPLTLFIGIRFLGDRKYYFISLLIILETLIPFGMVFESRKPQARELIVISVLCAMAVAGRSAFFMLPQFKPVVAIVIISGVCFGGETGFLVGAVTGFVSDFFFGQGPWTPWQMVAFGLIGFVGGILFKKGWLKKSKAVLCLFGFLATFILYGGIMNPASVLMFQNTITWEMVASSYLMGIPFDLIHAASTAIFLWFLAEPMIDKLERVKVKYGFIER